MAKMPRIGRGSNFDAIVPTLAKRDARDRLPRLAVEFVKLCHNRRVKDNILIRAIITGFGLRIGSEIGKFVAARIFPKEESKSGEGEDDKGEEDDSIGSVTPDPPEV